MSDQPSTPPPMLPTRAQVEDALRRLHDATNLAWPREEDVTIVEQEVARLRRHSEAFARMLGDISITPTDAGDAPAASVFQRILRHMMSEPAELDRAAEAILRAPRT